MTSKKNILFLPGDGIGPEVSAEAEKVLIHISELHHIDLEISKMLIGCIAIDQEGRPISKETIEIAKKGKKKYFKMFNEQKITKYIVDKSFRKKSNFLCSAKKRINISFILIIFV